MYQAYSITPFVSVHFKKLFVQEFDYSNSVNGLILFFSRYCFQNEDVFLSWFACKVLVTKPLKSLNIFKNKVLRSEGSSLS